MLELFILRGRNTPTSAEKSEKWKKYYSSTKLMTPAISTSNICGTKWLYPEFTAEQTHDDRKPHAPKKDIKYLLLQ